MINIILAIILLLISAHFLFRYVENLSVIFCIGLKKYNEGLIKAGKIKTGFTKLEVTMMIVFATICSTVIYFIIGLKPLLVVVGVGAILGVIRSWIINKFS